MRVSRQNQQAIQKMDGTLEKLEKNVSILHTTLEELKYLQEKLERGSFNLKDAGYIVSKHNDVKKT